MGSSGNRNKEGAKTGSNNAYPIADGPIPEEIALANGAPPALDDEGRRRRMKILTCQKRNAIGSASPGSLTIGRK